MNHPCGAVGISTVDVIVPKSWFDRFSELYGQVLGASPKIIDRRGEARRVYFQIGLSPQEFSPSAISRRPEKDELDQNFAARSWHWYSALVLSVAGREGHGDEVLATKETASTISLTW